MIASLEPRLRGVLGLLFLMAFAWMLSKHKRRFPWRVVLWGVALQLVLGLLFLKWSGGSHALQWLSFRVKEFLELSFAGSEFLFAELGNPNKSAGKPYPFVMAFMVLPTIIFFSSLMSVLYHLGIMQILVRGIAKVMAWTMRLSGAESLSAAANIFVGQTEAPLVVRPFVGAMTESELMAVMTGGFATIAGGVFALYVGFGVDPGHLLIASVMSAPAALVMAKIMIPETGKPATMGQVGLKIPKTAANVVEAAASGALDGLKLALNVAAMLIAFLGLVAVINAGLGLAGHGIAGITDSAWWENLSLQQVLGWIFAPFAAALGVEWKDVLPVGELLGTKVAVTELVAYKNLTAPALQETLSPRSILISTYALCGFANFGSVAIQLGGIGGIAPERKSDLARLGLKAMAAGALASWMTAALAGVLM